MPTDPLRYDLWIEDALREVVTRALDHLARFGLPGNHHFYITFRTSAPGVAVPPHLKALHPGEMTIVLQHQFWDLEVDAAGFAVTLSFKGRNERLRVPYTAIASFADPSVNFGLQFNIVETSAEADERPRADEAGADGLWSLDDAMPDEPAPPRADDTGSPKVVALDAFRKK